MIVQSLRTNWALDGAINHLALEQFATSIAAMARSDESPHQALDHILGSIVENLNSLSHSARYSIERLLQEKAQAYGYQDVEHFRRQLVQLIAERMVDLKLSHLNVEMRQQQVALKAG